MGLGTSPILRADPSYSLSHVTSRLQAAAWEGSRRPGAAAVGVLGAGGLSPFGAQTMVFQMLRSAQLNLRHRRPDQTQTLTRKNAFSHWIRVLDFEE